MNCSPVLASLLLVFAALSCQTPAPAPDPDPAPEQDGYVRVPLESSITETQPMTGIVIWSDSGNTKKSWVKLEFSYMLYSDVCKEQDVFDWTLMDRLLEKAAARGHQVVVRFRYTYPGKSCAVPDYIKALPGYEARWAKADGRSKPDTEYPDWRCEELQRFHLEFHRRFAERYDKDPRLAFVETGFGHWAEYHVYDGLFIKGQTFPSFEFQTEFLTAMGQWFQHTPWLFSIDAADSKYAPFHQQKQLLELPFGNFDDSFMCKDWDGYNWESWSFFGLDRYQKGPAGGEFSYYSSYDQKHALDKAGMYGRTFEELVARVHMTFIIGNDQPGQQTDERIQEACLSMGYHFVIKEFLVKPGTGVRVTIANTGVAPVYRDAYVAVDGVQADFNLRTLLPGQEHTLDLPLPAVGPSPTLTLECPALLPGTTLPFEAHLE